MTVNVKANVMWANLSKPNEMSGKYQVDLCNLSDSAVKALNEMGVIATFKKDDPYERGHFITCKSSFLIPAFDSEGEIIPASISIGNGSSATANVSAYEWNFKGKKGVSPSIARLNITNLIKYNAGEEDAGMPI